MKTEKEINEELDRQMTLLKENMKTISNDSTATELGVANRIANRINGYTRALLWVLE